MKKLLLSITLFVGFLSAQATIVTIRNSGFTFPLQTVITFGDTVNFILDSSHDAKEVSLSTYNANSSTALTNGFQTKFGGGMVFKDQLVVGTHYYVCTPHAGLGMKGTIIVQAPTSVGDVSAQSENTIYPNPAFENVNFTLANNSKGYQICVSDLSGNIVLQNKVFGGLSNFSVSSFANGIYLVKTTNLDNNSVSTQKLVVQN